MVTKKRKFAVFDVDGTIFRSSLLIELVEALIDAGIFPKRAHAEYAAPHNEWLDRRGSYDDYIQAVVDTFMKYIKGVPYDRFAEASKVVTALQGNRVYRFTRELLYDLKKRDYFLLAISQSPKTILDPFCRKLGFDKVYGRVFELGPTDKFTGNIIDLHLIANKANIIRRAIEKENLTTQGSIGVGDTDGDIPMLELVDRAICFNPNDKLYRAAKRNKWEVVVERKDVIYRL